jgi:hypothetical protein
MEVSGQFFRGTKLKKGDDWKKLLADRKNAALEEVAADKTERESLAKAFVKLKDFEDEGTAMILERVVKAKFGGESTWILLVHWEVDESVGRQIASGKEALLGHFLVIAIRASDQKIVSRAMCG